MPSCLRTFSTAASFLSMPLCSGSVMNRRRNRRLATRWERVMRCGSPDNGVG